MKMPMKKIATAMLLMFAVGVVHAADTGPHWKPLPTAKCIDPSQINEWHIVDARTAIVRTGPKRYLVTLQSACPRLGMPPRGLMFQPNRSNLAVNNGHICGEAGETVRSHEQPPCGIESIRMIDKARFDQLSAQSKHHGSGADQPTPMPVH